MNRPAIRDLVRLVRWEWRLEAKGYETILSMLLFGGVTLAVFSLAIDAGALGVDEEGEDPFANVRRKVQAGVLWVTLVTATSVGIDRAWRDRGAALLGLLASPVDRVVLFYARFFATALFVAIPTAVIGVAFGLIYAVDIGARGFAELAGVIALGLLGIVALGVTLGVALRSIRGADVLLRILLFPLAIPVFLAGVDATSRILAGKGTEPKHWIIVGTFAVIYVMMGQLLVDRVLEETDA